MHKRPAVAACLLVVPVMAWHAHALDFSGAGAISYRHAQPPDVCMQKLRRDMEARLELFPTSEADDAALLSSEQGSGLDWRDRRVVEFRRERKRALRHTVEVLREREKTAYRLLVQPGGTAALAKEEL